MAPSAVSPQVYASNGSTVPHSSTSDFSSLSTPNYKGYHHMTWYVGNAKQAASHYVTRFGFTRVAYAGLETGSRNITSQVISNGDATFVLKAPLREVHELENDTPEAERRLLIEIQDHLAKHGDAVKDVAFEVDDVRGVYYQAIEKGAIGVQKPVTVFDEFGKVTTAIIGTFGDTNHTLIEKSGYRGPFIPGYRTVEGEDPIQKYLPQISLDNIDHCVGNQDWGGMQDVCEYYEKTLSFHRFWTVDDSILAQGYSAMNSTVIASPPPLSAIKMPINEPASGPKKSQIEEFVNFNAGPGVQHIAFRCTDILSTVRNLRSRGVEFIDVPGTYYEVLRKRLYGNGKRGAGEKRNWRLKEDLAEVERQKVLIDFDEGGYLLQIFTKPVLDRPTVFIEIIQRENFDGFGAGNFKGLFQALEMEQERRGNL